MPTMHCTGFIPAVHHSVFELMNDVALKYPGAMVTKGKYLQTELNVQAENTLPSRPHFRLSTIVTLLIATVR